MTEHEFVICIDNHGYEASLEMRKLYEIIEDADADKNGQLRVIDESGEDYLYSATFFSRVSLPASVIELVYQAYT
jgi:hypothetical protein